MLYTNKRNPENTSKTMYFHYQSDQKNGAYTIAWREFKDTVIYSLAICSPKDRFSKKIGRAFTDARLDSVSYNEESGSFLVPDANEVFVDIVSLDIIKGFLKLYGEFPNLTGRKREEVINSLTLKDISYETFKRVFEFVRLNDDLFN